MEDTKADLSKQILTQLNRPGMDQWAAAYVKAWGEMPDVVKNANNPHLGNDYADLPATLATIKPTFAKYGLALLQCPGEMSADGTRLSLINVLTHTSGQMIQIRSEIHCPGQTKKDGTVLPATPQNDGGAFTYLARYCAQRIGGLAAVDDDGNAASGVGETTKESTPRPSAAEQQTTIDALIKEMNALEPGEGQVEALEAFRPRLVEVNDATAVAAYTAKRKELKKWKPAAK